MLAEDVITLYRLLLTSEITIWIDGGWGVDALLGYQSRSHSDLDIASQHKDLARLGEILRNQGYQPVARDDTTEWNFVLGDAQGRLIDIHAFMFDAEGNVVQGVMYPKASLTGVGLIQEQVVNCISPEFMVQFHTGYTLRDSDYQDVSALCDKFGIPLPAEYRSWLR